MPDKVNKMSIRTYSELIEISTFEERFEYLRLDGSVGASTFGFDRYLNQKFYRSNEWKRIRNHVIVRDSGCDLGILDREILDKIIIHHMNPIAIRDIQTASDILLNPEYLISTTLLTHNAIHYGDKDLLVTQPVERSRFDTCPWKLNERRRT